jgi:hypothetical protein
MPTPSAILLGLVPSPIPSPTVCTLLSTLMFLQHLSGLPMPSHNTVTLFILAPPFPNSHPFQLFPFLATGHHKAQRSLHNTTPCQRPVPSNPRLRQQRKHVDWCGEGGFMRRTTCHTTTASSPSPVSSPPSPAPQRLHHPRSLSSTARPVRAARNQAPPGVECAPALTMPATSLDRTPGEA